MIKIAVVQLTSTLEFKENLEKIQELIDEGKRKGATLFFLPECFYSLSDGREPTPYLVNKDNEHFQNIKNLALKNGIYLIGGSAATLENGKIVNRAYNFSPGGKLISTYDKINLFSCDLGKGKKVSESDIYTAGVRSSIFEACGLKVGPGICFDIRYPKQSLDYVKEGANTLIYPAAFTIPTGKAHWHILNRARAIESQCYVISAAQWGENNDKVKTFGHSLVVDPWGEVLWDGENGEKVGVVDIDLSFVDKVRSRIKL